jgi:hypothetical protein
MSGFGRLAVGIGIAPFAQRRRRNGSRNRVTPPRTKKGGILQGSRPKKVPEFLSCETAA